ncbi:hypothetical protein SAE02_78670 [Skermanella aerolata]|uniref:Uncharacterized protein n=1 Tax=Skermanella aerolata TaxID=393310 RepID=A0A512E501_9PROT|nr:hypothetical protein [Skermanella aerolata]KJB89884.1 hypothetical protein N826_11850 [Skermanella aerolata KACC 11604]GEO43719.1 hypothetical protein SAE02_78670 [Skermanella aerolata]
MPTETRQLIFSDEELIEALTSHNRMAADKLFIGRIVSCSVPPGETLTVRLTIRHETTKNDYDMTFGAEVIGAALIRYCLEVNIPLPRRARKQFGLVGGRPAISMCFDAHP